MKKIQWVLSPLFDIVVIIAFAKIVFFDNATTYETLVVLLLYHIHCRLRENGIVTHHISITNRKD